MTDRLAIYAELAKVRITVMVSITTIFGYILFTGSLNSGVILPTLGIFLLACGASVSNHYQERETDALMERTKNRPLPAGKIKPAEVLIFATSMVILGSAILYISTGMTGMLLGILALIWYNAIYTPLKKLSSLAVIPGSLIGAIPPVVGWVAGGGYVFDPHILAIAFYFFFWQIPHFWLLSLIYNKQYEEAGMPTLSRYFDKPQLSRITFIWIAATGFLALAVALFDNIRHDFLLIFLIFSIIWLIYQSLPIVKPKIKEEKYRIAFMRINYFTLFYILILSIDKMFNLNSI